VLQPDVFFNVDHYWTPGPNIVIGDRVFIGRGTEFNIRGGIRIGNDCLIASGCTFIDADHGREPGAPMNRQEPVVRPIRIGSNVWIGARAVVLKGVEIGDGAIVGAGSVVTRSVPGGCVVAGNPARVIPSR
jgi:acetyltransferase-like isoleucine patch superfamily enzyme